MLLVNLSKFWFHSWQHWSTSTMNRMHTFRNHLDCYHSFGDIFQTRCIAYESRLHQGFLFDQCGQKPTFVCFDIRLPLKKVIQHEVTEFQKLFYHNLVQKPRFEQLHNKLFKSLTMNGGAYVHEKTERHISWSAECASLVGFDRALAFEPNLILVGLVFVSISSSTVEKVENVQ